jgi:hypothetical protein
LGHARFVIARDAPLTRRILDRFSSEVPITGETEVLSHSDTRLALVPDQKKKRQKTMIKKQ